MPDIPDYIVSEMVADALDDAKPPRVPEAAVWTLAEGVDFCAHLWRNLAPLGWHCALTGSVLYQGFSLKDLDVIVWPHDGGQTQALPDIEQARELLRRWTSASKVIDDSGYYGSYREIWKGVTKGKRVDYFFLVDRRFAVPTVMHRANGTRRIVV